MGSLAGCAVTAGWPLAERGCLVSRQYAACQLFSPLPQDGGLGTTASLHPPCLKLWVKDQGGISSKAAGGGGVNKTHLFEWVLLHSSSQRQHQVFWSNTLQERCGGACCLRVSHLVTGIPGHKCCCWPRGVVAAKEPPLAQQPKHQRFRQPWQ